MIIVNNIPSLEQLCDQELGVAAFGQLLVLALQFHSDRLLLLDFRVLQSALNDSNRVVLEDEVLDPPGDNLKELIQQLAPLFLLNMRF